MSFGKCFDLHLISFVVTINEISFYPLAHMFAVFLFCSNCNILPMLRKNSKQGHSFLGTFFIYLRYYIHRHVFSSVISLVWVSNVNNYNKYKSALIYLIPVFLLFFLS